MVALGVDVSARRGMDAVLLDDTGGVRLVRSGQTVADLRSLLAVYHPDVVAVDAPAGPAPPGSARTGERELARLGFRLCWTPSDPAAFERPFYAWMRVGWAVFREAANAGYPSFLGIGSVHGHALEVFPHAAAVALSGTRPPRGWAGTASGKRAFRRAALDRAGVASGGLHSLDQLDAALAAVTGLFALAARAAVFGAPGEDALVVPDPAADGLRGLARRDGGRARPAGLRRLTAERPLRDA